MKIKYLFLFLNLILFNTFSVQIRNFNLSVPKGGYDSSESAKLTFFGTASAGAEINFTITVGTEVISKTVISDESNFWTISIPVENQKEFSDLNINVNETSVFDINLVTDARRLFIVFNKINISGRLELLAKEQIIFKGDRTGLDKICECRDTKLQKSFGFIKITSLDCFLLTNDNWKVETVLEKTASFNSCISETAFDLRVPSATLFSITSLPVPTNCIRLTNDFSLAVFNKYIEKFKVNSHPIIFNS